MRKLEDGGAVRSPSQLALLNGTSIYSLTGVALEAAGIGLLHWAELSSIGPQHFISTLAAFVSSDSLRGNTFVIATVGDAVLLMFHHTASSSWGFFFSSLFLFFFLFS